MLHDQVPNYCDMCRTMLELANTIRKKFTLLVSLLVVFQLALAGIYWSAEFHYIIKSQDTVVEVKTQEISALYAIEVFIMASTIYSRFSQNWTT